MKKKLVLILVVVMVLAPLVASSSFSFDKVLPQETTGWSAGLNLGWPTNAIIGQYQDADRAYYGTLGMNFGTASKSFSGSVGVNQNLGSFDINEQTFKYGVGAEVPVFIAKDYISVSALGTGTVDYTFENTPITIYSRVGAGVEMAFTPSFSAGFDYISSIGVMYNFENK